MRGGAGGQDQEVFEAADEQPAALRQRNSELAARLSDALELIGRLELEVSTCRAKRRGAESALEQQVAGLQAALCEAEQRQAAIRGAGSELRRAALHLARATGRALADAGNLAGLHLAELSRVQAERSELQRVVAELNEQLTKSKYSMSTDQGYTSSSELQHSNQALHGEEPDATKPAQGLARGAIRCGAGGVRVNSGSMELSSAFELIARLELEVSTCRAKRRGAESALEQQVAGLQAALCEAEQRQAAIRGAGSELRRAALHLARATGQALQ